MSLETICDIQSKSSTKRQSILVKQEPKDNEMKTSKSHKKSKSEEFITSSDDDNRTIQT